MLTFAHACPACRVDCAFTPSESQVHAEPLIELKVDPFADPRHAGAEDHQLYGYCLARCPHCGADVIIHFNIPLHRYLALVHSLFPEAWDEDTDVDAHELFARLRGDLRSFAIDPAVDPIDL